MQNAPGYQPDDAPANPTPPRGGSATSGPHADTGGELFDDGTVETLARVLAAARCLGSTGSAMGAWQNDLSFQRFAEAAVLDRACLEITARGYVPKLAIEDRRGEPITATYQGKGVWRVHQVVDEPSMANERGDMTRFETGTQHLLDLVSFDDAVVLLRQYVGHQASKRMAELREEVEFLDGRLAAL